MIFNGIDFNKWMEASPRENLGLEVEDMTATPDGADGQIFIRQRILSRTIPIFCRLQLDPYLSVEDLEKLRRKINTALMVDEPKPLYLGLEQKIYYMAKLTTPGELSNLWSNGSAEITFTAYDPIAFGVKRTVSLGASTQFDVKGTYRTFPVFDLRTTAAGKVRVTNFVTGEFILLATNSAIDDHIVIDCNPEAETTRRNTNLVTVEPSSDYFALNPGHNDIRISGAIGSLAYQERWK